MSSEISVDKLKDVSSETITDKLKDLPSDQRFQLTKRKMFGH